MILRRVTHLDQLADKLREAQVRRVIELMLASAVLGEVSEDDGGSPEFACGCGTMAADDPLSDASPCPCNPNRV